MSLGLWAAAQVDVLEDRTLLVHWDYEQYAPAGQPVACRPSDPWFIATTNIMVGDPIPTVEFHYTIADPANSGQFFE